MRELIAERTGAGAETFGKFFKINPKVDDLPDMLAKEKNGVKLLVMGTIETGGGGCVCPEHVMLKQVISHLIIRREDVVIMDMEAGLEHLGRGTSAIMDQFIVVVEPGGAEHPDLPQRRPAGRRPGDQKGPGSSPTSIMNRADEEFIRAKIPDTDLLGLVHYDEGVSAA